MSRDHNEEHSSGEREHEKASRSAEAKKIEKKTEERIADEFKSAEAAAAAVKDVVTETNVKIQSGENKELGEKAEAIELSETRFYSTAEWKVSSGDSESSSSEMKPILDQLHQIWEHIQQEGKESNRKKCCNYLNMFVGLAGNLVTFLGIWGVVQSFKNTSPGDPPPADPEYAKVQKILLAWQTQPDEVWWNTFANFMRANPTLTLNDHIFYLQVTMSISPIIPVLWQSYKDISDMVDKLITFYQQPDVYISDIYLEIVKPDCYYNGSPLPRGAAAYLLQLVLAKILADKLPVKRLPQIASLADSKEMGSSRALSRLHRSALVALSAVTPRPFLESKPLTMSSSGIDDKGKENISRALDIASTLSWAIPEAGPFISAGISLAKWIFGLDSAGGTDFTPIFQAISDMEKRLEDYLQIQNLKELIERINVQGKWMNDCIMQLDRLGKEADPIHAINAIIRKQGFLEELREMNTPKPGSLYSVINHLLDDDDFAVADAKKPVAYTDVDHFERVKLKYKMLVLGVTMYISSLKTQIMMQRFLKKYVHIPTAEMDDTVTYVMLFTTIKSSPTRGYVGWYDKIRVDTDLTDLISPTIFPKILARRKAMLFSLPLTAGMSPDEENATVRHFRGTRTVRFSATPVDKTCFGKDFSKGPLPPPYTVVQPYGVGTILLDRRNVYLTATPELIDSKHVGGGFSTSTPNPHGGPVALYGNAFLDMCWPKDQIENMISTYFIPDHSWGFHSSPFRGLRGGWMISDPSIQQSDWVKTNAIVYWQNTSATLQDMFLLKSEKGVLVVRSWLDAVAFEENAYQAPTPDAMTVTDWAVDDKPSDSSAWTQKDVQVRYAITYTRGSGGESTKTWTQWQSIPKNRHNPTLSNIVTPDDEHIDCIWIYRQFGIAVQDQLPSGKTSIRPIKVFSKLDKRDGRFAQIYQDITPAPAKNLLEDIASATTSAALVVRGHVPATVRAPSQPMQPAMFSFNNDAARNRNREIKQLCERIAMNCKELLDYYRPRGSKEAANQAYVEGIQRQLAIQIKEPSSDALRLQLAEIAKKLQGKLQAVWSVQPRLSRL